LASESRYGWRHSLGQEERCGVRDTPRRRRNEKRAELEDPLRSAGGLHEASRLQRGIAEFLRLPLLITFGFCVAGFLVSVLDASDSGSPVRELAGRLVSENHAVGFMSSVATSLLTVTSITFSVLLLAVQQTASSLTAVVFDQFLRRKSNQLFFGFFVGLSSFTFMILGLSRQGRAPVYGASLTLALIVAALVALLLLIHSTVDQMRPESVVRSIHQLALQARENELVLLGRTRVKRASPEGTRERLVRVLDTGYVVTVDVDRLARAARSAGPDVEAMVEGRLGEFLAFDEVAARLVGVDPADSSFDEEVLLSFGIDDIRDVDAESGYAIDQLENIAWVAATSALQSPNTAIAAARMLSDLLNRWLISGERDRSERADQPDELPVVYVDGAVPLGLASLSTLLVACAESQQPQTCAELIRSFTRLVPRLHDEDKESFEEALNAALPAVIQQAEAPALRNALQELERAMRTAGQDISRVAQVRRALADATRRLEPKPGDEPEPVHPA
jgi:uncharacterized membrane protein